MIYILYLANRKKMIYLLQTSLALLFAIPCNIPLTGESLKQPSTMSSIAKWNTTIHDFGNVSKDTTLKFEYTIQNTGKRIIVINSIRKSCGCTELDTLAAKGIITPSKGGSLGIKFKTKGEQGSFEKSIVIFYRDGSYTTLKFKGNAVL